MCSAEQFRSLPQELKNNLGSSGGIASFEWTTDGRHYLVSYWTVPMKFEFQVPGWIIFLKTSKSPDAASGRLPGGTCSSGSIQWPIG